MLIRIPRDFASPTVADFVFMANVSADEFSLNAEGAELLDHGLSLVVAAAGDNYPRALLGEG